MKRTRRNTVVALGASAALTTSLLAASPVQAGDDPVEHIVNGDFSDGTSGWWGSPEIEPEVVDGQLCADVPGGAGDEWDVIVGQDDVPLTEGESYDFAFTASASQSQPVRVLVQEPAEPYATELDERVVLDEEAQTHEFAFTASEDRDDGQVALQIGGADDDWTFCLDEVSLLDGAEPPEYDPDTGPDVSVNQVGYLPDGPKNATVVTEDEEALAWELSDADGDPAADGKTQPFGVDDTSDQNVHTIDFTDVTETGEDFTLTVGEETSHPFSITEDVYEDLVTDALSFYYPQRSGIEIEEEIAPGYEREAGHVGVEPNQGDTEVTCHPDEPCDYSLDVSGGWYDAGDHGKYVVNGGISVHQLMSIYERSNTAPTGNPERTGDSTLRIPETENGVPDVLDEARWQMEFMMSMQVPQGEAFAGMAHHKMHDETWTAMPMLPADDPEQRYLHPPSTAATLNLAATGAQCHRVFEEYDAEFADECLSTALTAWDSAIAHPEEYATGGEDGGGPYDDDEVADEFYWAAAELYLATGDKMYENHLTSYELHNDPEVFVADGFDWRYTAPLGLLQLATAPSGIEEGDELRETVIEGAQQYLDNVDEHPYGLSYAPEDGVFAWGSNNLVLNNMVVLSVAYDLTEEAEFREGVLHGMDYILGRNALNQSYVTGYGTNDVVNQHSRWYANQLDPSLPNPPPGSLSGGPNSEVQTWDPVAEANLTGCAPQLCFIDDIDSYATNELTINWNSTLAWVSAFVVEQ